MHLAHENWTLKNHQPNVRKDYKDLSRPKKQVLAHRAIGFFSETKQLTVAVISRQVKSGAMRVKNIRA